MATDRANTNDETEPGGGSAESPMHRLRYQELFEFAPACYLVTDGQGVIEEANQAAVALLQCPKEFLVGKPLGFFVTGGYRHRFYECLARLHAHWESDRFECRVDRRGGGARDVLVRVFVAERAASTDPAFRWIFQDITELRQADATRAVLLRRVVNAQEDERRRIARELHDSVGQLLSAFLLAVRMVRDSGPIPPATLTRLENVERIADELGRATHDLAIRLRPTALDDLGLVAALRQYLEEWSERAEIPVQFQTAGLEHERFPPDVETAFYRIVQEALNNVVKHARARVVSVVVERQEGRAIAVIEDDGVGFNPEGVDASRQLGLLGMRERMVLLGGSLDVESRPGAGTTVIASVSLANARRDGGG